VIELTLTIFWSLNDDSTHFTCIHIGHHDVIADLRIKAGMGGESNYTCFIEAPKGYDGPSSTVLISRDDNPVVRKVSKYCRLTVSGSTYPARRRFQSWLQRRCEQVRNAEPQAKRRC
jgi:hypothetical protein